MPTSLTIFGFTFYFYGFILGAAVLLTFYVMDRFREVLYRDEELTAKQLERAFWPTILGGLVGARLYHVVDYWHYYSQQPIHILALWQGGLGIYGALMGGVLGLWLASVHRPKQFTRQLDLLAIALPLGQALGRIANYVNQELYGLPANLPWSLFIDPHHRLPGYEQVAYYHPLFLYEALWSLVGYWGLSALARKRAVQLGTGNYFVIYIWWYSLGRTWLEFLRLRSWTIFGWPVASILGVLSVSLMTGIYLIRKRRYEW